VKTFEIHTRTNDGQIFRANRKWKAAN
jgi:hypothetical protein